MLGPRTAWSLLRFFYARESCCQRVQRLQPLELLHGHHDDDWTPMPGHRHRLGACEIEAFFSGCSRPVVTNMAEYARVSGSPGGNPEKSPCRWRSAATLPPASDCRREGPLYCRKVLSGRRELIIETAAGLLPGFSGCLALERSNVGEVPIALLPGMRICQIFLYHVSESHRAKS